MSVLINKDTKVSHAQYAFYQICVRYQKKKTRFIIPKTSEVTQLVTLNLFHAVMVTFKW